MPYQLAILQLSGFNVTGAKWSQQDALGYAADGVAPTLLQQDEFSSIAQVPTQKVLLAADGVHDLVTPQELVQLLAIADTAKALQQLQSLLLQRGAPDNASLLLLRPIAVGAIAQGDN